jgi:hypothetical protein
MPETQKLACSSMGPFLVGANSLQSAGQIFNHLSSTRAPALGFVISSRTAQDVTLDIVNLRVARVCLDCDEVHDAQTCPICASESFAFVSRWVPVPERRNRSRPAKSEDAEAYDQLVNPRPAGSLTSKIAKGALGLATITAAGWLWQRIAAIDKGITTDTSGDSKPPAE